MPFRRSIRLKKFDYRSDGAYFVTICTQGRLNVISKTRKMLLQRELLLLERRFSGVSVDFFVCMPNHLHVIFVFNKSSVALPAIVQAYKSRTTIALRKLGFTPPTFWQQNYYEHVIRDDESLNTIREYIRLNPEQEAIDVQDAIVANRRASSPPTL